MIFQIYLCVLFAFGYCRAFTDYNDNEYFKSQFSLVFDSPTEPPEPENITHSKGWCIMYDQVNEFYPPVFANVPSKKLNYTFIGNGTSDDSGIEDPRLFRKQLTEVCGKETAADILSSDSTCCHPRQLSLLATSLKMAAPMFSSCPACWNNFVGFWCHFTCSPDQSTFISPKKYTKRRVRRGVYQLLVSEVDVHIQPDTADQLFDSCKQVKFNAANTLAMKYVAAGAQDGLGMLRKIGRNPASKLAIDFPDPDPVNMSNGTKLLEFQTFNCSGPEYPCSCVDCSNSCPALPSDAPLPPAGSCWIGSDFGMPCISFGALMVLISLVFALLSSMIIHGMKLRRMKNLGGSSWNSDVSAATISTGWFCFPKRRQTWIAVPENEVETEDETSRLINEENTHENEMDKQDTETLMSEKKVSNFLLDNSKPWPIEIALQSYFRMHALWVYRHSKSVVFLTVLFTIISSLGLLKLQVETEPLKLWVDPSDQILLQKNYFDSKFEPFYRVTQLIMSPHENSSENDAAGTIFDFEFLRSAYELQKSLETISLDNGNKSLKDICFNPVGQACGIQSFADFYTGVNSIEMDATSNFTYLRNCIVNPSQCPGESGQPLDAQLILGGVSSLGDDGLDQWGDLDWNKASSIVITFLINNPIDNAQHLKFSLEWEKKAIEIIKKFDEFNSSIASTAYSSESSVEAELSRESSADVSTILLSYLLMFLYASFALGKLGKNCRRWPIDSKFGLGLGGILIVIFSVTISIGLLSAAGVHATLIIAEVIPFLVLAVGVDNIFIMVNEFERVDKSMSIDRRLMEMMAHVGPSIVLSSVTETMAFSLGYFVNMPAISVFSLYASTAVFIDFILQITCFVAFLSWDTRRKIQGRVDCFPCLSIASYSENNQDETDNEDVSDYEDEYGNWNEDRNEKSILEIIFGEYYAPFILSPYVKYFILAFFTISTIIMGVMYAPQVELGLDQRIALPQDSYLIPYFDALETKLEVGPPLYFVVRGKAMEDKLELSRLENQLNLCGRFLDCKETSVGRILEMEYQRGKTQNKNELSSTIASPSSVWIDDFVMHLNNVGRPCCIKTGNPLDCFIIPPDDDDGEYDDKNATNHRTDCACWKWRELNPSAGTPGHYPLFDGYLGGKPGTDETPGLPTNRTVWYNSLKMWLEQVPGQKCPLGGSAAYKPSIWIDTDKNGNEVIKSYYIRTYHKVLRSQSDFINSYQDARRIADEIHGTLYGSNHEKQENGLDLVFPYSPFYVFFSQYLTIWSLAFKLICCALIAVFFIMTLLTGSPMTSIMVVITVAMLLINLIGTMSIWDISLNAVSAVNLVIAVGIAVEFCVHIARGTLVYPGENAIQRSVAELGSSVFSGITITKLIGISVLAFAQSQIFVVYYFRMYLVIVILGALHGLVFLPCLLSLTKVSGSRSSKPYYGAYEPIGLA